MTNRVTLFSRNQLVFWLIVALAAAPCDLRVLAQEPKTSTSENVEIQNLIDSLPVGSRIRQHLEKGDKGDGVHYSWMDKMREQGVKRAMLRTEFTVRKQPTNVKVSRIVYFSKYDADCAQILDPERLSSIAASGLAQELRDVAVERTIKGRWLVLDKGRPHRGRGVGIIELVDNEWVPINRSVLVPSPKVQNDLAVAIDMDDVGSLTGILRGNVSAQERESALWAGLVTDDPCMTAALLKAGASPNSQDKNGYTLLMAAVRYQAINNVRALIAAGADLKAKALNGDTALGIAIRTHEKTMIEVLRSAGARE